MIHLANRTEYSFRFAAGRIADVLALQDPLGAGICDVGGTWGHIAWSKACKAANIKPILGVELPCVTNCELREKQPPNHVRIIAMNNDGLKELYEMVTLATEKFYYFPRIDYGVLLASSPNISILLGEFPNWEELGEGIPDHFYFEINQLTSCLNLKEAKKRGLKLVASGDNYYPTPEKIDQYQMVVGKFTNNKTTPQHILTDGEFKLVAGDHWKEAMENAEAIATMVCADLTHAKMVVPEKPKPLIQMCEDEAEARGIDLSDPIYRERLDYEIGMIDEKEFEDYFYVVSDLVKYAKKHMMVGPARGSSCGSLVCYLLHITDVDPIPFGLLFERFIDVNRMDYPDIDIDFADTRREMVFSYLQEKYGHDCVAKLGTVSMFKAKSAITDCSKALKIPVWEVDELKSSIMERSVGDARAAFCIMDTFTDTDIGKKTIEKYPELAIAQEIEGHARHTGIHAAGILVTNSPITNYCSINEQSGAVMLDKKEAEMLDLLKIDVLGLRTLSVIQDCLDQVGWARDALPKYRLDDEAAFKILSDHKFSGIFQFEGQALQNVVQKMGVESFEDIVSVTALARPGPLASGGTLDFVNRRTGKEKVTHDHPMMANYTNETYGVVVYQEQVMKVAREVGKLSWADTSNLRKAMSKSMGKEFFDKFFDRFKVGAAENGINEELARKIWDNINTMGSWAFNRSHAVAYGLMSYWSCVLKAHFPLEWAAACLRNAKDDDQSIKILRELVSEGFTYTPKDIDKSQVNWVAEGSMLIGPLVGIKGIGPKLAKDIAKRREDGRGLTARQKGLLMDGVTPWDSIFQARDKWGHIFDNPKDYNIASGLTKIGTLTEESEGTFVFIAKMVDRGTRDANELFYLEKRGGKRMTGQTKHLNVVVEDDTGNITIQINRYNFLKQGIPLIEGSSLGDWFIFKVDMSKGIRMGWHKRHIKLTDNHRFIPPSEK